MSKTNVSAPYVGASAAVAKSAPIINSQPAPSSSSPFVKAPFVPLGAAQPAATVDPTKATLGQGGKAAPESLPPFPLEYQGGRGRNETQPVPKAPIRVPLIQA